MQELFDFFDKLGIDHKTVSHPPMFTVDEGKAFRDAIPGLHCKSLFLKDKKDQLYLVVMPGDARADLGKLEKEIGSARLSFGKPELMQDILKVTPGSVTPFALINDKDRKIRVVLDRDMLKSELVNYHPLRNDQTTTIRADALVKFIEALGYEAQIVSCG